MRVAVVGHVEWVEFARVASVPRAGEIVHAIETWEQAGGGGAVAALQLARLVGESGEAHLFTALGSDGLGRRARNELEAAGVRVHSSQRARRQRRAFVHVDESGERTITVLGDKLRPEGDDDALPWHELARMEAVYFVSGDVAALLRARRGAVLVATARELATLRHGAVGLDALVGSGEDEGERVQPGELEPVPRLVVTTAGALGGWAQPGGPFRAAPLSGPVEDAYGCGDCFAAGLTFALGAGRPADEALSFAARCGAGALTGRGVHAVAVELEPASLGAPEPPAPAG